ncbi:MAG: hypothetical protein A2527_14300 [Candidatus Lambdaproteobacteria bacterium RIFOXYD2_FULL_50_16]|uniref:Tyr recombinase domain-containing protein n=1 Tax=Candidatus Lambdaproteobacteria bacterium RIFOXYD2_FULL_50_16 TaxID=1817772 RepID=A0A1F6G4R2_9PROT|nr:MAG: hypothetical protein A2527_14300 [Candidatus Lambdaproteobacteria bacterium RIFOXYD2_FULL_50_16]
MILGRKMVVAQLWEYMVPGQAKPPRRVLCSQEESFTITLPNGKTKRRSAQQRALYLVGLLNQAVADYKKELAEKPKQSCPNISEAFNGWLDQIAATRSAATARTYRRTREKYLAINGDHPLADYSHLQATRFLGSLAEMGLAPRSINKEATQLQAFLSWCFAAGLVLVPARPVPKLRITQREAKVYSLEQALAIDALLVQAVEASRADSDYRQRLALSHLRAWRLLRFTGFRASEVVTLKLSAIRLADGYILLQDNLEMGMEVKGRVEARVPIAQGLLDFLTKDLAARSVGENYYLDRGNGRPLYSSADALSKALLPYKRAAGVDPRIKVLHGLRGGVATWLSQAGAELSTVQKILRHKDLSTTRQYVNADMLDTQAALDKLPKDKI